MLEDILDCRRTCFESLNDAVEEFERRGTLNDIGRIVQGHHRTTGILRRANDPASSITSDTRVRVDFYKRDLSEFWDLP